jgi:hypothetical protein
MVGARSPRGPQVWVNSGPVGPLRNPRHSSNPLHAGARCGTNPHWGATAQVRSVCNQGTLPGVGNPPGVIRTSTVGPLFASRLFTLYQENTYEQWTLYLSRDGPGHLPPRL